MVLRIGGNGLPLVRRPPRYRRLPHPDHRRLMRGPLRQVGGRGRVGRVRLDHHEASIPSVDRLFRAVVCLDPRDPGGLWHPLATPNQGVIT